MISNFCKTYLKSQGVQILDSPVKETFVLAERHPAEKPVKIEMYER
jgi:hypothetical protein